MFVREGSVGISTDTPPPSRSPPLFFDVLRFQKERWLQLKRKLRFSNHFRKTWITLLSLVMAIMHTIIEFLLFIWNSTSLIWCNVYNINFKTTKVWKMYVIVSKGFFLIPFYTLSGLHIFPGKCGVRSWCLIQKNIGETDTWYNMKMYPELWWKPS